ncbi:MULTISPECIES: hypothetical protein [unclassified Synechococcus]
MLGSAGGGGDYWENVMAVNTEQRHRIERLVVKKLFSRVNGKRLTILGLP